MIVIKKDNETLEEALKRIEKEKIEKDLEWRKPRPYNEKFIYLDGFVKVIVDGLDDKDIKIYSTCIPFNDDPAQEQMSFNDILKLFGLDFRKIGKYHIIYIWYDSYMQGEIWKCSKVDGETEFSFYAETRGFE